MKYPVLLGLFALASCSDNAQPDAAAPDATVADLGVARDAEPADLGSFPDALPDPDTGEVDSGIHDAGEPAEAGFPDAMLEDAGVEMLVLESAAFSEGGAIPEAHSCRGVDLQPELHWAGVPAAAQSLALVLIDDSIDFVHWIAYNLPPATASLAEGASDMSLLPAGAVEADAYCVEYCGPCPPNTHTYTFRLYALDVATVSYNWPGVIRAQHLAAAFDANTLAQATLTGTFTP